MDVTIEVEWSPVPADLGSAEVEYNQTSVASMVTINMVMILNNIELSNEANNPINQS
jgi:hypothetical protein